MDEKVRSLWSEHDALSAELKSLKSEDQSQLWTPEDTRVLIDWHRDFMQTAVFVLMSQSDVSAFVRAFDGDKPYGQFCDPRAVNESLHALGCEVRLRWRTEQTTTKSGKILNHHHLERGRFRLGQQTGDLADSVKTSYAA
ncbi:MAG: hypothetical protein AB7I48_17285 [Planctomycetaceae bacterium]